MNGVAQIHSVQHVFLQQTLCVLLLRSSISLSRQYIPDSCPVRHSVHQFTGLQMPNEIFNGRASFCHCTRVAHMDCLTSCMSTTSSRWIPSSSSTSWSYLSVVLRHSTVASGRQSSRYNWTVHIPHDATRRSDVLCVMCIRVAVSQFIPFNLFDGSFGGE